jgi:hypothetical protein
MTKLPPPEQWVLWQMNDMEVAEMIEEHIDFVNMDGRSVHLPMQFVQHFRQRFDQVLPTAVALATAPIVLADGEILAPDGLDRSRGIVFEIPKELRDILPRRAECTDKEVRAAMQFLCDEWLCDVSANYTGKCVIIAAALTIMERSMLNDRPAFFVTAGRRGGGKTTVLTMLMTAVTGHRPAASAWSTNEEERRKSLLSQFMFGVPYILWDNIARGTQISCPHIERSCTAAFYSDRKLGVSVMVQTSASAIHFFTGNNISPRGDLASRSLSIRLAVDRPDPENRKFRHPDPLAWTENHRAELLRAFYTVLLANPELNKDQQAPSRTRFKMWWRIVGSAVEHAARHHNPEETIDFQNLFTSQEETEDEDSVSLVEALEIILKIWPKTFGATDIAKVIDTESSDDADAVVRTTLRDFLYPGPRASDVSPRSVGKRLKAHLDNPVKSGDRMLVLRVIPKTSAKGNLTYFVHAEESEDE